MRTIRDYVDRRAAEQPHDTWLIAPETGETMSYAQLRLNSIDLTRFLLAAGLKKGDKVALMLHNSYQTARLLIGVMYGGFMVAPLNLLAQPSQLSYVLQHSDTRVIFTTAEFSDRLEAALAGVDHGITIVAIDTTNTGFIASVLASAIAAIAVARHRAWLRRSVASSSSMRSRRS